MEKKYLDGEIKKMYYTISEVSEILKLSQNTVRHYEKQFKIRISRSRNGWRSYTPESLKRLKFIVTLLRDEGYTIKGAQKLYDLKKDELK